jgi:hypothetical protein
MFSLSSLMSLPDEEFDVLREDEVELLTRRFKRMQAQQVIQEPEWAELLR